MTVCAMFEKSPNCASHRVSASAAAVLNPYSNPITATSLNGEL